MKPWLVFGLVCSLILSGSAQLQLLWERGLWSGPGRASFYVSAVDRQGAIYLGGGFETFNPYQEDGITAKYTPDGSLLWWWTYNGLANQNDGIGRLKLDSQGNVIATGNTKTNILHWDIVTLKYAPDGTWLWERRYGMENLSEWEYDMVVDSADYGRWTDFRFILTKFDPSGRQLWLYHHPSGWTFYSWAFFDELGHVYARTSSRLAKFRLIVRSEGDVSGDGCVNDLDLSRVLLRFGSNQPDGDVNGDGWVDHEEVARGLENFELGGGN